MSYNVNIPTVTDKILQSFGQLRANFRAINNAFADNHVGLTQNDSISGMHTVLTLRTVTDPATSASQIALYNKVVSSIPAIFFRPSSNQTPIQLTYPSIKADSSDTQYSFVAGPFIVYGGFLSNVSQNQLVTLTPGTNLRSVDLVVANPSVAPTVLAMAIPVNIVGTSFNIRFQALVPPEKLDVYYFAVGQ